MFERIKGDKSFYYPYLRILYDCTSILEWDDNDLKKF